MFEFLKKKSKPPVKPIISEPPKLPKEIIEIYAKTATGLSRGMLTDKQRSETLDSMRYLITEVFNLGHDYGYEKGKQDTIKEFTFTGE